MYYSVQSLNNDYLDIYRSYMAAEILMFMEIWILDDLYFVIMIYVFKN